MPSRRAITAAPAAGTVVIRPPGQPAPVRVAAAPARPVAMPPGYVPCDDCAARRIRLPSGHFPPALGRLDLPSGPAVRVCDYHARERGARLAALRTLPDQDPPAMPGQVRRIAFRHRVPDPIPRARPLRGPVNPTIEISGVYA